MTEPEIYRVLDGIFADVFLRDDIVLGPAIAAKDIDGWDSFKQIEIVISVEQRFGVKLGTREIDRLQCVGDLVEVIRLKAARDG